MGRPGLCILEAARLGLISESDAKGERGGINNDLLWGLGFRGTVVLIADVGYLGKEQIAGHQEFGLGHVTFIPLHSFCSTLRVSSRESTQQVESSPRVKR